LRQVIAIFISFFTWGPLFFLPTITIIITTEIIPLFTPTTLLSATSNWPLIVWRLFANHSYTIPMRPPVQFPKSTSTSPFTPHFPALNWICGADLFPQPRFDAQPVLNLDRNFLTSNNFKTADSPQVIEQTDVAVLRKDTVKLPDSILLVNRNGNTGLDLKTKSITPPQQDLLPTQLIKGRVLDLVPPALGRFYGITEHQTPVAPQSTDATSLTSTLNVYPNLRCRCQRDKNSSGFFPDCGPENQ
jgi:hypothetical protein